MTGVQTCALPISSAKNPSFSLKDCLLHWKNPKYRPPTDFRKDKKSNSHFHTALHEQNAFPGVTNKLLAPDVDIVFAAVPAAVEKLGAPDKTLVVGNPVRPEVFVQAANREAIRAQLGAGDRTVILSFGGSLGARRVNEVVADLCAWEQQIGRASCRERV